MNEPESFKDTKVILEQKLAAGHIKRCACDKFWIIASAKKCGPCYELESQEKMALINGIKLIKGGKPKKYKSYGKGRVK